jgi:hypothetical protein
VWLASCSHISTVFAKGRTCQEKVLCVGLQALASSFMYLSTYLPSFIVKKKQPQKKQKRATILNKFVLRVVSPLPIGFFSIAQFPPFFFFPSFFLSLYLSPSLFPSYSLPFFLFLSTSLFTFLSIPFFLFLSTSLFAFLSFSLSLSFSFSAFLFVSTFSYILSPPYLPLYVKTLTIFIAGVHEEK